MPLYALLVGSRDHTPLPENTILTCRHTDRFTRWKRHVGEVGKEQTETDYVRAGREVGKGIEGCQIRGMFGIDSGEKKMCHRYPTELTFMNNIAERLEECFWRSDSCCPRTTRARQKEAMQNLVESPISGFHSRRDTINNRDFHQLLVSYYLQIYNCGKKFFVLIEHATHLFSTQNFTWKV